MAKRIWVQSKINEYKSQVKAELDSFDLNEGQGLQSSC